MAWQVVVALSTRWRNNATILFQRGLYTQSYTRNPYSHTSQPPQTIVRVCAVATNTIQHIISPFLDSDLDALILQLVCAPIRIQQVKSSQICNAYLDCFTSVITWSLSHLC